MNNLQKLNTKTKKLEETKARILALIMTLIYTPLFIYNFIVLYNDYSQRIEEVGSLKFFTGILIRIIIICLILVAIEKLINIKLKVRDVDEFKQKLMLLYIPYIIIFIVFINYKDISIVNNSDKISIYLAACGILMYLSATEYSTNKMGMYNEHLDKFITYPLERKFSFKQDLRESELKDSSNPIEILTSIVEKQTEELPYGKDLNNLGKYKTYYIQSYKDNDKVYVIVGYSKTGRQIDSVITFEGIYDVTDYEEKLENLNNKVNIYLRRD